MRLQETAVEAEDAIAILKQSLRKATPEVNSHTASMSLFERPTSAVSSRYSKEGGNGPIDYGYGTVIHGQIGHSTAGSSKSRLRWSEYDDNQLHAKLPQAKIHARTAGSSESGSQWTEYDVNQLHTKLPQAKIQESTTGSSESGSQLSEYSVNQLYTKLPQTKIQERTAGSSDFGPRWSEYGANQLHTSLPQVHVQESGTSSSEYIPRWSDSEANELYKKMLEAQLQDRAAAASTAHMYKTKSVDSSSTSGDSMEIHLRQITLNKEAVSALCAQLAVALARHGAAVPPLRHMQDIIHSWQGSSTAPSCDSIDGAFECDDVYVESSKSASPEPWLSLCGLAGDDPSERAKVVDQGRPGLVHPAIKYDSLQGPIHRRSSRRNTRGGALCGEPGDG